QDVELVTDSDLHAWLKPNTDVIVTGHAYAHRGPTRVLDAGVHVGSMQRVVRIHGDRRLVVRRGQLSSSSPEPFERMELSWRRAYGGRDHAAETRAQGSYEELLARRDFDESDLALVGAFSYPRNRIGSGFWIDEDRDRLDGARLPNFEDVSDPIRLDRLLASSPDDWIDRPTPAGFGAVDALTFPRGHFSILRALFRPPARPVREVELGWMSEADLDPHRPLVEDPRA